MVALTSALEPTAVQTLIEKMEDIRDSIQDSIHIEDDAESKHARVAKRIYMIGQRCDPWCHLQCHREFDQRKVQR